MLRLSIAQAPAQLDGEAARLDWLREALPEVRDTGADLLALPELFATGYNIGAALAERAEGAEGPIANAMSSLAREFGVAIHYGFPERSGAAIFNASACVAADGTRLVLQRKLAIPPGFERDYFSPGTGCQIFTLAGLRIATLICYDAEFSETVRHVAALGAQLVIVPTALGAQWRWVAERMIPTRAYENGVYLAYINSAGREGDLEFLGASVIAAPDGVELARAGAAPEVLHAVIDPGRITAAQARLPYLSDRLTLHL